MKQKELRRELFEQDNNEKRLFDEFVTKIIGCFFMMVIAIAAITTAIVVFIKLIR